MTGAHNVILTFKQLLMKQYLSVLTVSALLLVSASGILKAQSNTIAVDLGLSVKWASCNLGASAPEEFGDYYAWGETETKGNYRLETYKWCQGSYNTLTKYNNGSYHGTVDNKTVLDPKDDVAHVKLGGSWRMPTKAELDELMNNCTWTWTTLNGASGFKVTGSNGNSIFLPAAGSRNGTVFNYVAEHGYYWSSSLYTDDPNIACTLSFNFDSEFDFEFDFEPFVGSSSCYRYEGLSVRAVTK